ncbi:MAG: succinate dehydrogenase, cytochrome b556 subunit [Burkholderiales bacterium]
MANARPKYLNLFQIRQPVPAVVSILHRISGALLFLFLWLFLKGLDVSLASPESFDHLKGVLTHPLAKLLTLGLVWAYVHHTFAGIRHLGLDLRLGIDLPKARASAFAVLALSLAITLVIAVVLW